MTELILGSRDHSRPLGWGPLLVVPVVLLALAAGVAAAASVDGSLSARPAAPDSSTATADSYWGAIPARGDSVTAAFTERSRPAWETAVLVPYWVVGVPFRLAYLALDQTIVGMDKLGLFGTPGEYPGLRGPLNTYLMPDIAIDGLEGVTLGVQVTRPHFITGDNKLFLHASRSTRNAGKFGGGTIFHLGEVWHLEAGGGFESANQTRYYGLGTDSLDGDLSYYYRSTTWGGFDLNRDLGANVRTGVRAYFSQIQAREPKYNEDKSIGQVHGDDLPYGYPGQSNGWTVRWGLDRDSAAQNGRPKTGGYEAIGVSLFRATDGADLSYLTWHGNFERFLPLWHTDRTLAVRAFGNRITNLTSDDVPFTRLVTFQRPDQLRGFSSLRYYGMGSVGLSAEYRWPIWVARDRDDLGVDAYVFSDAGQVFDHTSEIGIDNFKWTGGWGLRLVDAKRDLAARFELGFSDEDVVVRLKFSQTFQYNPRGFLHGKDPTKIY